MVQDFRGKVFKQWLTDLPQLVIRAIGIKGSKMNPNVVKEMYYLQDRRDKALDELHKEYYAATNSSSMLVRPSSFRWIDDYIKAAEEVIQKNPRGGDYISPVAEDLWLYVQDKSYWQKKRKIRFWKRNGLQNINNCLYSKANL